MKAFIKRWVNSYKDHSSKVQRGFNSTIHHRNSKLLFLEAEQQHTSKLWRIQRNTAFLYQLSQTSRVLLCKILGKPECANHSFFEEGVPGLAVAQQVRSGVSFPAGIWQVWLAPWKCPSWPQWGHSRVHPMAAPTAPGLLCKDTKWQGRLGIALMSPRGWPNWPPLPSSPAKK